MLHADKQITLLIKERHMPRESDLEMKIGFFVVIAVVCLVAFIFSISDFSVFRGGTVYHVVFGYANGLKKNAPVRLAGVDAGHVRDLKVSFDRRTGKAVVAVEAWVAQGIDIPSDSQFLVNQLGLLGEKYLEIMPGTSTQMLPPGTVVKGEDPIPMEAVTKQITQLGAKVEMTLNGINTGVLSEANTKALASTLANIASVSEKVKSGEGTVGMLLSDPLVYQNLSSTLANVASLTDKLNNGEGTVGRFLVNPGLYQNLEELSADLKANPWKLFYRPRGK
jgi:phospholipid/cholesterol/gamma-HCH transport system substrate-binding protein